MLQSRSKHYCRFACYVGEGYIWEKEGRRCFYIYILLLIFGCARASLLCWFSLVVVCRLLTAVASLVKYRL